MSHFTVLVIGENPEKQLQPFHEYECTGIKDEHVVFIPNDEYKEDEDTGIRGHWTNPNAKWDWYVLGGRWTGFFKTKAGAMATVGRPGILTEEAEPGFADQLLKRDVDFDFMRNEAGSKAQDKYEYAMGFLSMLPKNETWEEVRERISDVNVARDLYWNQTRCKAWKHQERITAKEWPFGWSSSPDQFLISQEDFIENARNSAATTHAILKDGKWYEHGKMGWWAMVSHKKDDNDWNKEFSTLLDGLPGDTLLSLYDCHI